ncbi:tRNA dihydrouridine synthase DusB [Thermodesulfobacteriota bacterium]
MLEIGTLELENNLMMAPMAGVTNLAFRLMVKSMGAGLVFSEMVSAMGLKVNQEKTMAYLRSHSSEKPLAVQIFGSKPDVLAKASQIVIDSGADCVDINMGCPVKKVTKTGAGSSLLRDPKAIEKIVTAVRIVCSVPLTVKIRTGWSPDVPNACEIAHILEDCGVDAVTIHPRFATQGFTGTADWSVIRKVKESVKVPVIGNGDILVPEDVPKMIEDTGCDGVMIGRTAVSNPWIFRQVLQLEKGLPAPKPDFSERRTLILDHYNYLTDSMGEYKAALPMRGLLLRYTKGLPHSTRFREKITRIKDFETLSETVDEYFTVLEGREI